MILNRPRLGLLLLMVLSLVSSTLFLKPKFWLNTQTSRQDPVVLSEQRYQLLKRDIPNHGELGYISTASREPHKGVFVDDRYYLAEFALAPRILARTAHSKLVVGDFNHEQDIEPVLAQYPLKILKDYGNGLFLLTRQDRSF